MRAGPPVTVRYVDWRTRQGSAAYTANLNLNVKVLDFIQFGGPDLTMGSTVFEMWIGI